MNNPLFSGVCTALVTPFLNGKINYPMLRILLDRQQNAGIPAVVLAGTTGEAATLSDTEQLSLIRYARTCLSNHCLLIAGAGSNDTVHAAELSVASQEAGADALLIVSPYYNKTSDNGLLAHYLTIAQCVQIPIILYNVPGRTGVDIPVSVYKELSSVANIIGVKEASADIIKVLRIREACGPEFSVWTGNDHQILPAISFGAQGVISVVSNVYPKTVSKMVTAAMNGNHALAVKLQHDLLTPTDLLFCEVNPMPVKAAMATIGFDCGECRLPLTNLTIQNQNRIEAYFGSHIIQESYNPSVL